MSTETQQGDLAPLKISCTHSECDQGLHCFRKSGKMSPSQIGSCRACGARLVNWDRVHKRDLADADATFASLQHEWIRHRFWHAPLDQVAELHARRKGRIGMREAAEHRIRRSVGGDAPFHDGYQTPFEGNVLYYAQHAIGCCCRTCMEYWHGIPKGRPLTEEEISYFTALVMMFVRERMPELTEDREKIPRRRTAREKNGSVTAT